MTLHCSHFGLCGGCRYTTSYGEELSEKEKIIAAYYEDFGLPISPILPSPNLLGYRSKMEFSFGGNLFEKKLGLSPRKTKGWVMDIESCALVSPWFSRQLSAVRQWWKQEDLVSYLPQYDRGHLRTLTLREGIRSKEKMVVLHVNGSDAFPIGEESLRCFVEATLSCESVESILMRRQISRPKEKTYFEERVLYGKDHIMDWMEGDNGKSYRFKIKATSFFQPNPLLIEKLFAIAREQLENEPLLLDLYCGVGTFGILASEKAKKIVGVELSKEALLLAQENLELNGLSHFEMIQGDVGGMQPSFVPSAVVIDPPRLGLNQDAMDRLLSFSPKKILYISCHPETQVRDVKILIEKGYRISTIQPADQFPRTHHIENLVVLEKAF